MRWWTNKYRFQLEKTDLIWKKEKNKEKGALNQPSSDLQNPQVPVNTA